MGNIKEIKIEKEKLKKLKKKKFLKNLQKNAEIILTFSPLIVSALFITGSIKLGQYEKDYNYCVERIYDSEGNDQKNFLKTDPDDYMNTITVYGNYEKNSDNKYERDYSIYEFKTIDEDTIEKAFNGEINDFSEVFGDPITTGKEVHEEVTEEEKTGYIEAKTYSLSNDRVYTKKIVETTKDGNRKNDYWFYAVIIDIIVFGLGIMGTMKIDDETMASDNLRYYFDRDYTDDEIKKTKQKIKLLKSNK